MVEDTLTEPVEEQVAPVIPPDDEPELLEEELELLDEELLDDELLDEDELVVGPTEHQAELG